jgi:hypothetical protein
MKYITEILSYLLIIDFASTHIKIIAIILLVVVLSIIIFVIYNKSHYSASPSEKQNKDGCKVYNKHASNIGNNQPGSFLTTQEKIKPHIEIFVAFHLSDTPWPLEYECLCGTKDKNILIDLLKNNGIKDVTKGLLEQALKDEYDLQVNNLFSKIKPHIEKFVAFHLSDTPWPLEYENLFSSEDKIIFTYLLEDEGIRNVTIDLLEQPLRDEYDLQANNLFSKFFLDNFPDIQSSKDIQVWINAYCDLFGHNKQFLPFLQKFAGKYIIGDNLYLPDFEEYYSLEMERRTQKRKIERLKKAMNEGRREEAISMDLIDNMEGIEFEEFLKKFFETLGYNVELTKSTGDQGADLIIKKYDEKIAVQAKCYSGSVGNSSVQEIVAAKKYYQCNGAMVVTNSYFTNGAIDLAKVNNVELWDRKKLEEVIQKYL